MQTGVMETEKDVSGRYCGAIIVSAETCRSASWKTEHAPWWCFENAHDH